MNMIVKSSAAAAAVPVAAVPALASPACTLPPDLIERLVRVRAWYLDYTRRCDQTHDEIDRRFHAITGLTSEQWRDLDSEWCHAGDYDNPSRKELRAVRNRIYADYPIMEDNDPEGDQLYNERWNVAEGLMDCQAQTVADLAWQVEAWMLADLEIFSSLGEATSDKMIRKFFHRLRALGGVPQPDDPQGLLNIDISEDGEDDAEA